MVQLSPLALSSDSDAAPNRILVVEDGVGAAEVIAMFFEMEGMQTAVAYDGMEAVEVAERFHPHLICMDLAMPRMNGFEAALRIREKLGEVIIVALCGWDEGIKRQAMEAGFDDFMAKPVTPDDLRRMIERFLATPLHANG
jgi:CheY-like chemotaxis protein